jgi:hypothetical protein
VEISVCKIIKINAKLGKKPDQLFRIFHEIYEKDGKRKNRKKEETVSYVLFCHRTLCTQNVASVPLQFKTTSILFYAVLEIAQTLLVATTVDTQFTSSTAHWSKYQYTSIKTTTSQTQR